MQIQRKQDPNTKLTIQMHTQVSQNKKRKENYQKIKDPKLSKNTFPTNEDSHDNVVQHG